jgi:hypothetical protein
VVLSGALFPAMMVGGLFRRCSPLAIAQAAIDVASSLFEDLDSSGWLRRWRGRMVRGTGIRRPAPRES